METKGTGFLIRYRSVKYKINNSRPNEASAPNLKIFFPNKIRKENWTTTINATQSPTHNKVQKQKEKLLTERSFN